MMVASKTNSIYRDKPKAYKCFIFVYKVLHVVFGLQFGFVQFKDFNFKIASVIFMIIQTTTYCAIKAWDLFQSGSTKELIFWTSMELVQYLISTLMLACTKKKLTFCSLYHDLQIIDLGLKVNHASYYLELKLLVSIFACLLIKFIINMTYCFVFRLCDFNWSTMVYTCTLIAQDVILISSAFMFYAINSRLKKLASLVKSENSNFLAKQYLYKSIVDIAELHVNAIVPMFLTTLMINIPLVMATIYFSVLEMRKNVVSYTDIVAEHTTAFQIIILTLMPAFCAGMLSTQAKNLKIILHNKLLQPQDEAQAARIELFISYVEARGCRWRVCKLLPLDARLLSTVLSFCATYLIVIIQFTYEH